MGVSVVVSDYWVIVAVLMVNRGNEVSLFAMYICTRMMMGAMMDSWSFWRLLADKASNALVFIPPRRTSASSL